MNKLYTQREKKGTALFHRGVPIDKCRRNERGEKGQLGNTPLMIVPSMSHGWMLNVGCENRWKTGYLQSLKLSPHKRFIHHKRKMIIVERPIGHHLDQVAAVNITRNDCQQHHKDPDRDRIH